jgi:hypothetical protein
MLQFCLVAWGRLSPAAKILFQTRIGQAACKSAQGLLRIRFGSIGSMTFAAQDEPDALDAIGIGGLY